MFTMETAFTVTNKDIQINTMKVYVKAVTLTISVGDELMLDAWNTWEDA